MSVSLPSLPIFFSDFFFRFSVDLLFSFLVSFLFQFLIWILVYATGAQSFAGSSEGLLHFVR